MNFVASFFTLMLLYCVRVYFSWKSFDGYHSQSKKSFCLWCCIIERLYSQKKNKKHTSYHQDLIAPCYHKGVSWRVDVSQGRGKQHKEVLSHRSFLWKTPARTFLDMLLPPCIPPSKGEADFNSSCNSISMHFKLTENFPHSHYSVHRRLRSLSLLAKIHFSLLLLSI